MKKRNIRNLGGGATLLTACSAGFGDIVWEKLLRYYGTKALRSKFCVRKPDQQYVILRCLRHDNTPDIGGTCQPEALAEGSQKVNEKLKQVQHDKNFGRICKVQDAKYVSKAHRKRLFPYSPIILFTSKKAAFTLAEVLITLGIIGIVAAMTIPTLVQSYKKKVVETKLVKVVSMMNQAIKFSTIENGETSTWKTLGTSTNSTATYDDILAWYNTYLDPYLKSQKVEKVFMELNGKDYLAVYLMDGSVLVFAPYIYDITYYINTNDINKPNLISGKDYFMFRFLPKILESQTIHAKNSANAGFAPYTYDWDGTYEGTKNSLQGYGCYDTEGSGPGALCTKLIELNGWKIPDDYPYKF